MKLKRAKAYKKYMGYLHINFGFREPYQVMIDEEIILEAVKTNYDLVAGLERTLHGKVKPMITQCTIEHLYRAKNEQAIDLAKSFERRRCGHIPKDGSTLSAFECIASVVDVNGQNKHRYTVATQKPKLRAKFRKIPAVPLIYIHRSVMILEPLSPATADARKNIEASKLSQGLNAVAPAEDGEEEATGTKRKRTKEPNPLSVKKKKTTAEESTSGQPAKSRRKRGKKRDEAEQAEDHDEEGNDNEGDDHEPEDVEADDSE